MGNNAFDDLKKRAREDAYADIRQWMFWLPLTPNELTILGAIYAVQIENGTGAMNLLSWRSVGAAAFRISESVWQSCLNLAM